MFFVKNLLLVFLFTFLWVCLLPLYPSVGRTKKDIPDEEYVIGAMMSVCTDILPQEALKAIAVTVRTYTAYHGKVLPVTTSETVALSTSKQHAESVYEAMKKAAEETAGEYLTFSGNIINACFHPSSHKNTADGDAAYLKSVSTPDESGYPRFYAESVITARQVSEYGKGEIVSVSYGSDGKAKFITFEKGEAEAEEFIKRFAVRSTDFSVSALGDGSYTVISRGEGNGYGLSLYGAYLMALEGKDYGQILNCYFSGVALTRKT